MITVACVKWGDKYSEEYVYRLRDMVAKNLSIPHQFVCISDEFIEGIYTSKPPNEFELDGWWPKMFLYRPDLFTGKVLYLDLDTVIQKNIDALVSYSDGFCGVYTKWNPITTDGTYAWTTLRHKIPFNSS